MKKRPPKRLENLEHLLQQAEHYCEFMMSGTAGTVPPTLMALTPEGFIMHVPDKNATEEHKDRFAKVIRLVGVGYKATAIATIMEAWIVVPKKRGQQLDMSIRPSQSPDKEEVVSIVAETREGGTTRFLFIQRDSSGKFAGFGTSLLPDMYEGLQGRFAGLLPKEEPTDEMAMVARNMLQMMGVAIEKPGFDPKWN